MTQQSLSADSALGLAAGNETATEPMPLPKITDQTEVKFETPKISPPAAAGTAAKLTSDGSGQKKLAKAVIVAVMVVLAVGSALAAGVNLVRRQKVGEIRKLAGTGATPTVAVTALPTPTLTPIRVAANCDSLVSQMPDESGSWVTKTDGELVALARPGDKVRFMCTGAKLSGNFTKLGFLINKVLYADNVVQLSETEFAVEYTIPTAGVLQLEAVWLRDS